MTTGTQYSLGDHLIGVRVRVVYDEKVGEGEATIMFVSHNPNTSDPRDGVMVWLEMGDGPVKGKVFVAQFHGLTLLDR